MAADNITVRSLSVQLPHGLGPSAFGLVSPPPCPISVTLAIHLRPDVVPSCVSADTMSGLGVNYSAVTKEDVQRVAKKYFGANNRTVATLLLESGEKAKP